MQKAAHPLFRPPHTPRPSRGRWLVALLLCLLPFASPLHGAQFGEYEIKAGFLYNFLNFVSWSETADGASPQMVLVVLDTGAIGKAIAETLASETVRGKPLKIVLTTQPAEARKAHLLFIPASYAGELDKIFQVIQGRPVLTVGESNSFIATGGMINFVRQGSKVRFEINPRAAHGAGLRISSQLLKLAIIAEPPHSSLADPRQAALLRRKPGAPES
ncbi:MAG: YfiR family protein [Thermodesulfobacteriota bacterium]